MIVVDRAAGWWLGRRLRYPSWEVFLAVLARWEAREPAIHVLVRQWKGDQVYVWVEWKSEVTG